MEAWAWVAICVAGLIVYAAFMLLIFGLCHAAAVGDAMMERHLQYLREKEEMKASK